MWKWSWPNLMYYTRIYLDGLRITTKALRMVWVTPSVKPAVHAPDTLPVEPNFPVCNFV
jgi:hypothetical protein